MRGKLTLGKNLTIKPFFIHFMVFILIFAGAFLKPQFAKADLETAMAHYRAGNLLEAIAAWESLASFGNPDAFYNLGQINRLGLGRPKSAERAVYFYRRAAESGHEKAQGNLAVLFYFGEGVAENKGEAIKWWRSAARLGHGQSQMALAILYFKGEGVPQDYIQAFAWISLSEQARIKGAKDIKDKMTVKMTPNHLIQGAILSKGLLEPGMKTSRSRVVIDQISENRPKLDKDLEEEKSRKEELESLIKTETRKESVQKAKNPLPEKINLTKINKQDTRNINQTIMIQVGAFRAIERAQALILVLDKDFPSLVLNLSPAITDVDLGSEKGFFYRLRYSGFLNRNEAIERCWVFKDAGKPCTVLSQ